MKRYTENIHSYQNYVAGDSWKCSKSPTGAHHWNIVGNHMKCKHCNEIRNVNEVYEKCQSK